VEDRKKSPSRGFFVKDKKITYAIFPTFLTASATIVATFLSSADGIISSAFGSEI
jgi:hypothetical protein